MPMGAAIGQGSGGHGAPGQGDGLGQNGCGVGQHEDAGISIAGFPPFFDQSLFLHPLTFASAPAAGPPNMAMHSNNQSISVGPTSSAPTTASTVSSAAMMPLHLHQHQPLPTTSSLSSHDDDLFSHPTHHHLPLHDATHDKLLMMMEHPISLNPLDMSMLHHDVLGHSVANSSLSALLDLPPTPQHSSQQHMLPTLDHHQQPHFQPQDAQQPELDLAKRKRGRPPKAKDDQPKKKGAGAPSEQQELSPTSVVAGGTDGVLGGPPVPQKRGRGRPKVVRTPAEQAQWESERAARREARKNNPPPVPKAKPAPGDKRGRGRPKKKDIEAAAAAAAAAALATDASAAAAAALATATHLTDSHLAHLTAEDSTGLLGFLDAHLTVGMGLPHPPHSSQHPHDAGVVGPIGHDLAAALGTPMPPPPQLLQPTLQQALAMHHQNAPQLSHTPMLHELHAQLHHEHLPMHHASLPPSAEPPHLHHQFHHQQQHQPQPQAPHIRLQQLPQLRPAPQHFKTMSDDSPSPHIAGMHVGLQCPQGPAAKKRGRPAKPRKIAVAAAAAAAGGGGQVASAGAVSTPIVGTPGSLADFEGIDLGGGGSGGPFDSPYDGSPAVGGVIGPDGGLVDSGHVDLGTMMA
ncbi:hypothetical protein HK101_005726 [Irineochytrium annulatum]|nr:hypothetical protein HK101_005726 [Irineochytrium annulatum]